MNFAIVVGAIIGLATAGPLSDWVSARATKRNGGILEPEMRLPAMSKYLEPLLHTNDMLILKFAVPYVLIMILGNFVVAFGYQQK